MAAAVGRIFDFFKYGPGHDIPTEEVNIYLSDKFDISTLDNLKTTLGRVARAEGNAWETVRDNLYRLHVIGRGLQYITIQINISGEGNYAGKTLTEIRIPNMVLEDSAISASVNTVLTAAGFTLVQVINKGGARRIRHSRSRKTHRKVHRKAPRRHRKTRRHH